MALQLACARRSLCMARLGIAMLAYDPLKLLGTLFGVVFAVVLGDQQLGTFLGVLYKNVMFVEHADADLWILPVGVEQIGVGDTLDRAILFAARSTQNVARAEAITFASASVRLATGGRQQVQLVGCAWPYDFGGPWSIVRGDASVLAAPSTMFFEDGDRDNLGGLHWGDRPELNGREIRVGGFTWGLLPFGPSYAFGDADLVRELTDAPPDRASAVLVRLSPGANVELARRELMARTAHVDIRTADELREVILRHLLLRTAIGVTFGTSTLFALVVGFVIVALSMFSSVVDNLREFGTLKALGATDGDLACLLGAQALCVAVLGALVGLAIVTQLALALRNPRLTVLLPGWLLAGTAAAMIVMCAFASVLALKRIRRVEPGMVFR